MKFNGDHKRAVLRYSILQKSCILTGPECPFAVLVREPAVLHAEFTDALLQRKSMVKDAREVFTVQLPAINELETKKFN